MTGTAPRMPCLESGFAGFHHTLDSALRVLTELGVSPQRISIRMAGHGYPSRWIVAQDPRPGAELGAGVMVKLSVSGLGYFHTLPFGMWDKGAESELGTQEVVEILDDPLQKAGHWIREGARLFDLQPDDFNSCSRWISLFGLNPEDWPPEKWYNLSLLLPSLQRLAATEQGIRLFFQLLLELPVKDIQYFAGVRTLAETDYSLVGTRFCRLGVDCIVGNEVEDFSGTWLTVGPISLEKYYAFQQPEKKRLVTRVLDLCSSCQRQCCISWLVSDPDKAPQLGLEIANSRLGINSHLGRPELVNV
jgi:Type VI secretion, TssG